MEIEQHNRRESSCKFPMEITCQLAWQLEEKELFIREE